MSENQPTSAVSTTAVVMDHDGVQILQPLVDVDAGWAWLIEDESCATDPAAEENVAKVMDAFLAVWLQAPFEGGRPPAEVIRCDRVRIPLVSSGEGHVIDCDCPICEMMASGMLGPGFTHFDGHQLDVDGEFAFSMCATRAEWEEQQREWAEMNARIKADMEREAKERAACGDDEFQPVWNKTLVSDDGIPGDSSGHLKLAIMGDHIRRTSPIPHLASYCEASFRGHRCSGSFES